MVVGFFLSTLIFVASFVVIKKKHEIKTLFLAMKRIIEEDNCLQETLNEDEGEILQMMLFLGKRNDLLLHEAIRKKAIKCVMALTPRYYNPNFFQPPKEQFTPLQTSVVNGSIEIARYLLSVGADPMAEGKHNFNALHIASAQGRKTMLQLFLEKVEENIRDKTKKGLCANIDFQDVASCISHQNYYRQDCLHLVSHEGRHECLNILLKYGPKLNQKDFKSRTPFDISIERKEFICSELLLRFGAIKTSDSIQFSEFRKVARLETLALHQVKASRQELESNFEKLPIELQDLALCKRMPGHSTL